MQTYYDGANIINLVDSPEDGLPAQVISAFDFELPLETRISDLVSTVEASAEESGFELPSHICRGNISSVEVRLYNIFVEWLEKNDMYDDCLASREFSCFYIQRAVFDFLQASLKHDNHKWLADNLK